MRRKKKQVFVLISSQFSVTLQPDDVGHGTERETGEQTTYCIRVAIGSDSANAATIVASYT